jgi:hypothetical protein
VGRVVLVTNGKPALAPSSRPPANAFILGGIEVAIIATAIVMLFVYPSSTLVLVLGSIGAAAGVLGLISLVWGNRRRITVIYDSVVIANAIMNPVRAGHFGLSFQDQIRLQQYERALLRVGAYKEAFEIRDFIEGRETSGPDGSGYATAPA